VGRSKTINGEEFWTIGRAARELEVSPATLRRWCDLGPRGIDCVVDPGNGFRYLSRKSVEALKSRFTAVSPEIEAGGAGDSGSNQGMQREKRRASLATINGLIEARQIGELTTHLRKSEDWELRARAAEGLGTIGSPEAVPALTEALLKDNAVRVRVCAADSLGRIASRDAVPALTVATKDPDEDEEVRAHAADGLVMIIQRFFARES
jgi:hypothetical protein